MKFHSCQRRSAILWPYVASLLVMLSIHPIYASTGNGVTVYTPYTKISVPPGESINYDIDVINKSGRVKNVGIAIKGLPKGWSYDMKSGGWDISQLSVLPKDKKSLSLRVEVPLKVNKGAYHFYVTGNGRPLLPLTVIVSQQGTYETEFSTDQPNMVGHSTSSFTFNATLRNRTGEKQLYALSADVQPGWEVSFMDEGKDVSSVNVEENGTANMTIKIIPPAGIKAGKYSLPIAAKTGSTAANLTLEVVVTGSYKMELTTPAGLLSTSVTAGKEKQLDLIVKNAGTTELNDITFNSELPSDWSATYNPAKISHINAGETVHVTVTLKASSKAIAGDYIARFTARTLESNSIAEFRVAVKTSLLWGWLGICIIAAAGGSIYYLFRKYGRR